MGAQENYNIQSFFLQNTQLTGTHMGLAWGEMVLVGVAMLNRPEVSASSHGAPSEGGKHKHKHEGKSTGENGRFRTKERISFGTQQNIAKNQADNRSERRVSNERCNRVAVEIGYSRLATIRLGVGEAGAKALRRLEVVGCPVPVRLPQVVIDLLLEGLHRLLEGASTEDRGCEAIPAVNHTGGGGGGPNDIVPRLRWY